MFLPLIIRVSLTHFLASIPVEYYMVKLTSFFQCKYKTLHQVIGSKYLELILKSYRLFFQIDTEKNLVLFLQKDLTFSVFISMIRKLTLQPNIFSATFTWFNLPFGWHVNQGCQINQSHWREDSNRHAQTKCATNDPLGSFHNLPLLHNCSLSLTLLALAQLSLPA